MLALLMSGALSLNMFGLSAYAQTDTSTDVTVSESEGVTTTTTETTTTWTDETEDTSVSGSETTTSSQSTENGEVISESGSTVGSETTESLTDTEEKSLSTDEVDLPEGAYTSSDSETAEFESTDTGIGGTKVLTFTGTIDAESYESNLQNLYPDATITSTVLDNGTTVFTVTTTDASNVTSVSYENTGVPSVGDSYTSGDRQYTVTNVTVLYDENGTASGYTTLSRVLDEDGNFLYTESRTVNFTKVTTSNVTSTELEVRVAPTTIDVQVSLSDVLEGEDAEQNLEFVQFTDPTTFLWYTVPGNYLSKVLWIASKLTLEEDDDNLYQYLNEYIISEYQTGVRWFGHDGEEKPKYLIIGAIEHFILRDKDNNAFYAYCMDLDTNTQASAVYKLINLEDADYLTQDDIAHVRSIAKNGYWGTDAGEDADNPSVGSLKYVKKMLLEAIANGSFSYDGLTEELVNQYLNEGLAMTATQAALWKYANRNVYNTYSSIVEEDVIYSDYYSNYTYHPSENEMLVGQGLYYYLIGQEPEEATGQNTLLDSSRISGANVTLSDLIASGDYQTASALISLIFLEDVRTYSGNVDIGVWEVDENGNKVGTSPISIWNLFGGDGTYPSVTYSEDGKTVTIDGVTLEAGKKYMLSINGTQILSENVPAMFAAIEGTDTSQSMITMISGSQTIDLYILLDILMNYEEDISVTETTKQYEVTEKEWSSEWKTESDSEKTEETKNASNSIETGVAQNTMFYVIALGVSLLVILKLRRAL